MAEFADPAALERFADAAEAAADLAARAIRPLFRNLPAVDSKADESPVTVADREAERVMRGFLGERFPEHGLLGEEWGAERPDAEWRWTLDPIDGTRAFITGRPLFGTLIALSHRGRPVLGLIDQPVTGERWLGIAGRPTRFTGPFGGRAGTRACPALAQAELSATLPAMFPTPDVARFARLEAACGRITWGGDCYAYGLLALGQIDVIAEAGLKPWDWAALQPVIEGAGGRLTDWRGEAPRDDGDGRILAVGDPALLNAALECLAV